MTRGSVSNLRRLFLERQGEIVHLVFDRPERRNASTEEMWPTLSALAEQAEDDDRIKMSQASLRTMKEMMRMVAGGQITDDEETERMWRELTTGPDHSEGVRRFPERWR